MCDVAAPSRHGQQAPRTAAHASGSLSPKLQKFPAEGCPLFPEKSETDRKNIPFTQQQMRLQNTVAAHPTPATPVRPMVGDLGSLGSTQAQQEQLEWTVF